MIQCKYHGRTFNLSGELNNAPGFEETNNFPTENDNLNIAPIKSWNNFTLYNHANIKIGSIKTTIE